MGTLAVPGLVVALLRDRLVAPIERLAEFANRDPLTELLNRRGFEDASTSSWSAPAGATRRSASSWPTWTASRA